MPSPFRILEILTCSLMGFLPYVMLLTYPFRNSLRAARLLTALAAALQLIHDLAIGLGLIESTSIATLLVIGIHVLLAMILIRAPLGKKLFSLLTTINSAIAISLAAQFLEGILFPEQTLVYQWTYLVLLLALQALILLPFGLFLMKRHICVTNGHQAPWRTLWLIPAFVLVSWAIISRIGLMSLPADLIMIGLTTVSCAISLPLIRKPQESTEETSLSEAETVSQSLPEQESAPEEPQARNTDFTAQMQAQHLDHLTARIEQSNQFHRELRRHIEAMSYRLEKKQYDKLRTHLSSLQNQFDYEDHVRYCENTAVNTILAYFCQMAGYFGIKVSTDVHLPGETAVAEADLSALFGDLLDNALDACKKQSSNGRQISVSARVEENTLHLSVENTFENPVLQDNTGGYLSSKHDGYYGMGLEICNSVAARYNGKLEISENDGMFKVGVILKF